MSDTAVIWCHGSLSQPWGAKSKSLAEIAKAQGFTMEAPDFQDLEEPDQRVQRLVDTLKGRNESFILAGSSMGGYVAAAAARHLNVAGLFLMAPAFYFPGYETHVFFGLPESISVVHGWNDDVVPVDHSIRFAKQHKASLHILADDHRLSESIPALNVLFNDFLKTMGGQD